MSFKRQSLIIAGALKKAFLVAILALYGLAALKIETLHHLVHKAELQELHTAEQESNPCHKSIYHQQTQKGCEHQSHITTNSKCPLCEFNSSIDSLLTDVIGAPVAQHEQPVDSFKVISFYHQSGLDLVVRGPPAC